MFDNIGKKIKSLAQIVCWIGIIAYVIFGILLIASSRRIGLPGGTLIGIVVIGLGVFASWLGSIFTYGFGELIDTNQEIAQRIKEAKSAPAPAADFEMFVEKPKSAVRYSEPSRQSEQPQQTPIQEDKPKVNPAFKIDPSGEYFFCPVCNWKQRVGRRTCYKCHVTFADLEQS